MLIPRLWFGLRSAASGSGVLLARSIFAFSTKTFVDKLRMPSYNDHVRRIQHFEEDLSMANQKALRPTAAELAILQVLWDRGKATVREVQEQLEQTRGTGYTTTLKLLQIMHDKGLVRRNESQRTHVYEAAISREKAQRQIVSQLLHQVFEGSAHQLVLQALQTKKSTRAELAEIRKLLDELEGAQR
jgi:predicted transcriptional regulator